MTDYFFLIPIALVLGAVALGSFMWSLKSGQYEDLAGAAVRITLDDGDVPESPKTIPQSPAGLSEH